jgi:hypothetical protein
MACVLLLASYVRGVGDVQSDIATSGATAEEVSGAPFAAALAQLVTPDRFPDLAPLIAGGAYTNTEFDDFAFGIERMLDGIQRYIEQGGSGAAVTAPDDARDVGLYGSDKRVKEAAKARREAEKALRDARKRERDALKSARERAQKERGTR